MITPMRLGRFVLAALIMLAPFQISADGGPPAAGLRSDPKIQALIEQAVVAIVRGDEDRSGRLDALREPGAGDRGSVLLQLALYLEKADGTERSMAGALILHHIAFTPDEKLQAIIPHLDTAGPGLRRVFTELLGTIDRRDGGEPDFRFYETRILKEKDAPPSALIGYLYEVSPDAALASMERIYGGSPAQRDAAADVREGLQKTLAVRATGASWSAQDRARIQTTLEALSLDPAWWRRLYAAAILSRNPDLATAGLMKRLRSDSNPLVRDTVSPDP